MKTPLLKCLFLCLLTAILSVLLTCYFCKKKHHDGDDDGTRSLTSICMDYDTEPAPVLTTELVKTMVTTYRGSQLNSIQTAPTNAVPKDAQSIWFDLETLKKFLYHLEHNVDKNATAGTRASLGVRIYYAAYPEKNILQRMMLSQVDTTYTIPANYEKLHTLVMIPTISYTAGENLDFNPLDVATYNGFVNMKIEKNNPRNSATYSTLSLGTFSGNTTHVGTGTPTPQQINARNHGGLCPPALPSVTTF